MKKSGRKKQKGKGRRYRKVATDRGRDWKKQEGKCRRHEGERHEEGKIRRNRKVRAGTENRDRWWQSKK